MLRNLIPAPHLSEGPRLPQVDNRTLIVGQSGTGKSVAGAHHLLRYREQWPKFPWIVFNPKRDQLLDSLPAEPIDLTKGLPKKTLGGKLFMACPVPESDDDDAVNEIIEQALWHTNCGLYFDEGYSIPSNSKPYRRALTQGRSKKVPVITLSQRPVFIDKFAFTEANFVRVFYLVDQQDRKRVKENTGITITDDLPNYHSFWYEVSSRKNYRFDPGPDEAEILQRFRDLEPKEKRSWL